MITTLDSMRCVLRHARPSDVLTVCDTGGEYSYTVQRCVGLAAVELELAGVNGAKRTLIDGVHTIWMRRETRRGSECRRVTDLYFAETDVAVGFDPIAALARAQTAVTARADARIASTVDPQHYGGADNVYEAIKVIDAWGLGFALGNAVKYIARAGRKDPAKHIEDLKKARWYLDHEIERLDI